MVSYPSIGEAKIIGIVLNHIHWVNKTGEFGITMEIKNIMSRLWFGCPFNTPSMDF